MVTEEEENSAVQIIGLDVIERTRLSILDRRYDEYLVDGPASMTSSDDDDDVTSTLSDNDSLDLNGRNCRRNNRRRLRRGSNDSYANDSLKIARKKLSLRDDTEEKDRIPIGTIEVIDLSSGEGSTPLMIHNHGDSLDKKGIIAPVAAPDVDTMMPKRVSNSAA